VVSEIASVTFTVVTVEDLYGIDAGFIKSIKSNISISTGNFYRNRSLKGGVFTLDQ
jgi:hypothetical protein